MSEFLELTGDLKQSVEQLNQVLQGDENSTVNINGVEKPSITKLIIDTLNSIVQLVTDAAADIDAVKYETTSAGLAATTSGQYFSVVSGDDKAFLKLYKNDSGTAKYEKTYPNDKALDALYSTIVDELFVNQIEGGDFIGSTPDMRSTVPFVDFDTQSDLLSRGYKRGVRWNLANNFARASTNTNINGMYAAGSFLIYSENAENFPILNGQLYGNVLLSESPQGALTALSNYSQGYIQLSENLIIVYAYGKINSDGDTNLLVGTSTSPVDYTRFATGFFGVIKSTPFDIKAVLSQLLIEDKYRLSMYRVSGDSDYQNTEGVTQLIENYGQNGLAEDISKVSADSYQNILDNGDFVSSDPVRRSGSNVVNLDIDEFKQKGLYRGLNLRVGGNEFVITPELENLNEKYVFSAFYIHSSSGEFPTFNSTLQSDANGSLTVLEGSQYKTIDVNAQTKLMLYTGKVNSENTVKLAIGSSLQPVNNDLYTSGYYLALSDNPISFDKGLIGVYTADKCRKQIRNNLLSKSSNFVLNGENEDSYILGVQGTDTIKRVVRPFPRKDMINEFKVFNFNGDYINGQVVKTGSDDVAPHRVLGTTVGANHGYKMGRYAVAAHNKLDSDIGSIYINSGQEFVILGIYDTDSLWLAHKVSNSTNDLISGTFTHVSGGENTSSFVGNFISYKDFHPVFQNRKIKVVVDEDEVTEKKGYVFKSTVKFIETYDILSREEVLDWYINYRAEGEIQPKGMSPSYSVSMVYEFNTRGDCTIYSDLVFLKPVEVQDLMFLQAMRSELNRYYIPKCVPFVQQEVDFNYSLIEPANKTSSNGLSSIYLNAQRLEQNKLPDRFVGFNDGSGACFSMGYLPVYSADLATRIENTVNRSWEIRGNTDKMYPRILDKGDFIASVGESYSIIGYRNVFKPSSGVTSNYSVKSKAGDYYFIDWHDVSKTHRVELPIEYHGREIEIIEQSENVILHTKIISDSLLVTVDCSGSYGYLVVVAK
jgi:hypothetical protein